MIGAMNIGDSIQFPTDLSGRGMSDKKTLAGNIPALIICFSEH
jgi:hypothetical protein